MKANIPIYTDHNKTFYADTCRPLREAAGKGALVLQALARGHYPGSLISEGELRGVNSIGFWDITHPQEWGLPWHRNEGIEITFLENGSLPFEIDDQPGVVLKPYNLTITRPWQPHKIGNPNIANSCLFWLIIDVGVRRPHQEWQWPDWIILSRSDLHDLTILLRENEQAVWFAGKDMQRIIKKNKTAIRKAIAMGSYTMLAIYINELLLEILQLLKFHRTTGDKELTSTIRNVSLFLSEISSNIGGQWTTESMAEYCHVGVTSFIRYCKELKNVTPIQYLNQLRINQAAMLLLEKSENKIIDIAFLCGFNSSQYFATVFRSQFGCTPKEYRNLNCNSTDCKQEL